MFLPFNRVVDVTISWSDYAGCRTAKVSGGDPWDWWERLYIDTPAATHEIGWDVFARNVSDLMTAITAYREAQFRLPGKEAMGVVEFNRRRFEQPLRVQWQEGKSDWFDVGCAVIVAPILIPLTLVLGFAGGTLAALLLVWAAWGITWLFGVQDWAAGLGKWDIFHEIPILGSKVPLVILVGGSGGVLLFVGWMVGSWLQDRRKASARVLELRADGLAVGRTASSMRLIPWEDILYASLVEEKTYKSDGTMTSSDFRLEVHLRAQPAVVLDSRYDRPLQQLCELIDPPLAKVADAKQRIAEGADIETAAVTAGLPAAATAAEAKT
jgi:hypothetical protein